MEEVWKDVVGFEGFYVVSNLGRVYSNYKKGRVLKPKIDKDGYHEYGLYSRDTKKKTITPKLELIKVLATSW